MVRGRRVSFGAGGREGVSEEEGKRVVGVVEEGGSAVHLHRACAVSAFRRGS